MQIKIVAADSGSPAGKLADAEIHFTEADGLLAGLRLIGFSVWERRTGNARRNVTMPARTYSVNGERRSFALLRPAGGDTSTTDAMAPIVAAILDTYERQEDDAREARQAAWKVTAEAAADAAGILDPDPTPARYQTDAERLAAGLAASRQPGGISILDMMPGGKYGKPRQAPRSTPDLEF